jgi:hypothetical protein
MKLTKKEFNEKYNLSNVDKNNFKLIKQDLSNLNNISGKPLIF